MAIKSLTAMPLSHNDISSLAELLERNIQYHCKNQPNFKQEYINNFKAVVGLGFTAIMVDGSFISTHQPDFNRFLDYCRSSTQGDAMTPASLEAARILMTATCVFPKYDLCYDYYQIFEKALKKAITSGLLDSSEIAEESHRLLQLMLRK